MGQSTETQYSVLIYRKCTMSCKVRPYWKKIQVNQLCFNKRALHIKPHQNLFKTKQMHVDRKKRIKYTCICNHNSKQMLSFHVTSYVQFIHATGSLSDHLPHRLYCIQSLQPLGQPVRAVTFTAVIYEIYNSSNTFSIVFYSYSNLAITSNK